MTTIADIEKQAAAAAEAGGQQIPRPDVTTAPPGFEPPKKRGRPSNKDRAAREAAQAAINGASGREETAKAAGEGSKKAKAKSGEKLTIDQTKFAGQIQGLHIIAAKLTGQQLLLIDEKEAYALAEAIANVAKQYDIQVNPRVAAGLQLAATAAMIYAPRLLLMKAAADAAKNNTVDLTPNPGA